MWDPGQLAPQPTRTLILVILYLSRRPAIKAGFRCLSALKKIVHLTRVHFSAFLFLSALKFALLVHALKMASELREF